MKSFRIVTVFLIFSLFIFCQTQETFGQKNLLEGVQPQLKPELSIPLELLFTIFKASKGKNQLGKACSIQWHPGDYYYEKNYKIIEKINRKVVKCVEDCLNKMHKNSAAVYTTGSGAKQMTFGECYSPCAKKAYKYFPTTVATCQNGEKNNYYSDGSYYKINNSFELKYYFARALDNTHNLKDKYEKNEWQIARDECMEITSEKDRLIESSINRLYNIYNDCLRERGF